MQPIGKLKQNLEFNKGLGGIIEALKVAASIQLRQFQAHRPLNKEFLEELKNCISMVELGKSSHALLESNKDLPKCLVAITSDEGFLGALNALVMNSLFRNRTNGEKDKVVILGERGRSYLVDANISYSAFSGISDELRAQEIEELKWYLLGEYLTGKYSEIVIIYPKFESITVQHINLVRFLPCNFASMDIESEAVKGKDSKEKQKSSFFVSSVYEDLLIEPNASDVVGGLVNLWSSYVLADIFWSSKLSEFSARLMHLDESEQELSKVNKKLNLEYFKHMHAIADKTIREISAARFLKRH